MRAGLTALSGVELVTIIIQKAFREVFVDSVIAPVKMVCVLSFGLSLCDAIRIPMCIIDLPLTKQKSYLLSLKRTYS